VSEAVRRWGGKREKWLMGFRGLCQRMHYSLKIAAKEDRERGNRSNAFSIILAIERTDHSPVSAELPIPYA
jgi:hypothetical protein